MFEEMTYENILEDMLSRVTSNVDKREGSIIFDALAPCAYQLAQNYYYLNNFIDLVSGDTAVGEYLDKVVADYGITRKPPTYSVRMITTSAPVSIGTRWGIEDLVYTITSIVSPNVYEAECGTYGTVGNIYSGTLTSIDNVGSVTAVLADILTSGSDEESDDNLRSRFMAQIQKSSTSGNAYDYRNWALDVPGIGDAKVIPLWNGNGTVKVLIVDNNMEIDETLESKVYDYIETVRPIGAEVTVSSPTTKSLTITADIELDGTETLSDVKAMFSSTIITYLKETVFKFYSLSYAKIGSLLLATPGISDYTNLSINGGTQSITIGDEELPILDSITLTEVI